MGVEERRLGPFVLKERLGEGGMGTVYRATHAESRRAVAVKVLSAKAAGNKRIVARFARELEILKALKHPHIVRCYGGGRQGNEIYLVMELVTGGSLAGLIKRRGRLPWEAVIDYGLQICEGLACAHEWGVIHRDLTPANLLLTEEGKIKIADFGIARVQYGKRLTAAKHTLGTVAYMSPEQIRGEPPVSHRTDLYTLGCVLFELLTGKLPFNPDSTAQMLFQHLDEPPPRVTSLVLDCPVWLDLLVGQLLEKDPLQRPHDATAVAQALSEARQKAATGAGVTGQAAEGRPSKIRVPREKAETQKVRKLLGRKKKRKKEKTPFYERVWFLAACLLLVVGAAAWLAWPPGEEKLFAEAERLMAGDDQIKWKQARENYLEPLLERFPDSAHAPQARAWIDQIDMAGAERRLTMHEKMGNYDTEAERLYADARRFEQFGDRVSALEKYQSIPQLIQAEGKERPYVKLAERRASELLSKTDELGDRLALVEARLDDADRLETEGKRMEARKIWNSIVTLYGDNRELQPQVERAQQRLSGEKAASASNAEETLRADNEAEPQEPE